ncbi:MAG: efflux RND transporter periplasmic adaptor subunit [Methyloceanibacter sp.]|uniref:efflux RND transporter periplasmic adaptor subunit n=1 Tax=Methyloceanibacter sp. TaxID=1965321 RepID=UPI003D6C76A9
MVKRLFIAGIIIALFLGGVGYFNLVFKPQMIADFVSKMAPPTATVTAEPAKLETWTDRVRSIGTLIAIEGVEVAPEVGGIVSEYYFDSGEDVQKGEKLVQLDISVELADLKNNEALLQEAELHLKRQASLVKREVTSQATLESAIAKRDSAVAAMERIEALIAQKTILAPFSGQLGLRRVEKGQYVSPGQALVWLQALDPIWVDFPVPEGDVGKFKVGAKIELTVDTYVGHVFEGIVEAFDARLSKDSRTLMVRGTLKNPDRKLLPGMFAQVAVLAGSPKELVTVPRTAVTYSLYGDSVWVVKETAPVPAESEAPATSAKPVGAAVAADAPDQETKLTVERRFVRVGPTQQGRVAIVEGVKAGEQVVTSGQLKLQPGATVKIDNADTLKPPAVMPKQ